MNNNSIRYATVKHFVFLYSDISGKEKEENNKTSRTHRFNGDSKSLKTVW